MSAKPEELERFLFFDSFKFVMIRSNKNAVVFNGSGNSYCISERKPVEKDCQHLQHRFLP